MTWNIQILEDCFKIETPELDDRYFTITKVSGTSTGMFKVYKVIDVLDIKEYSYVKCNIVLTRIILFDISLDDNKYHISLDTIVYDETNRDSDIENKYKNCQVLKARVENSKYRTPCLDIFFQRVDDKRKIECGYSFDRVYGNGDGSSGDEYALIIQYYNRYINRYGLV